ncbi:hypothetical protein [Glutamicibacter sp.]|uniref:hypothetical protein n=1 Tax=Glutamicibacter sp. TaxID=1931995 RepID=UPI003D6AC22E
MRPGRTACVLAGVAALLAVVLAPAAADASEARQIAVVSTIQGDPMHLAPADSAQWLVGISLPAGTSAERTLRATGELSSYLDIDAVQCDRPEQGACRQLLRLSAPAEGQDYSLGGQRGTARQWLRFRVQLRAGSPAAAQAARGTLELEIQGSEERVEISPGGNVDRDKPSTVPAPGLAGTGFGNWPLLLGGAGVVLAGLLLLASRAGKTAKSRETGTREHQ